MNVSQSKDYLEEPVEDKLLVEVLLLFSHFLDMISQIAFFAVLHDNDEESVLDEAIDVLYDVRMLELLQKFSLVKLKVYLVLRRLLLAVVYLA